VSVSRVQIEVELHSAERALEAARERRVAAEKVLWTSVSRSGGGLATRDEVDQARSEVAEANAELAVIEGILEDLRKKLDNAQHREERLLAVTDMLLARDESRRRSSGDEPPGPGHGDAAKQSMTRRLLDRLRRH
jgi:outer membrane protein TolC